MSKTVQPRSKLDKNSNSHAELINQLEQKFTTINQLLYTTNVPNIELEERVLPYIAEDVVFKDPWQEGGNKNMYRIGMKGMPTYLLFFHSFQL